ncbi:hypothetical protein TSAR_015824 [Trichomalopsis sarcophagae]|uniref:Uncharacterized protein n=1 Tax=Trichomalopsis sarcophagae TaxID=543379 RepID=A0A232EEK0_9HYME|nr:hypothetical protein TSAR_015824 [Trichomalopsis sarcophagae]
MVKKATRKITTLWKKVEENKSTLKSLILSNGLHQNRHPPKSTLLKMRNIKHANYSKVPLLRASLAIRYIQVKSFISVKGIGLYFCRVCMVSSPRESELYYSLPENLNRRDQRQIQNLDTKFYYDEIYLFNYVNYTYNL